jgi:hypothetical protein
MNRNIFNSRNLWWLFIILLLAGLIIFESFFKVTKDFDIFIGASRLLRQGRSCYNEWIPVGDGFLLYYYSPLFALLVMPLSFLPQHLCYLIWMTFNVWLLYRIIVLIDYYLDISRLFAQRKARVIYSLLVTACVIRFLVYNLDLGQMTILLLYCSLKSVRMINDGRKWAGSALLALAINIKLIPVALLFYLIYRGQFRSSLLVILFFVVYSLLPSAFIGNEFNTRLLHDWAGVITKTNGKSIEEDQGRTSLSALVPSLLMETKGEVPLKRNIFTSDRNTAMLALNISRAILVALTLYFLRTFPFKKARSLLHDYYALSYILLVTPLIAPHQGKYSFFYLLPAYSYILFMFFLKKKEAPGIPFTGRYILAVTFTVLSFILATVSSDGIIGNHFSLVAEHFHSITIGTLILIVPLMLLPPPAEGCK